MVDGAAVVDLAQLALLDIVPGQFLLAAEAQAQSVHQRELIFLSGIGHAAGLPGVERGRLFADDVLAGFERVECDRGVEEVGQTDTNRVQLDLFEHLLVVGKDVGDLVLGGLLGS